MLILTEVIQVLMRSAIRNPQSNPYAEEFEERKRRSSMGGLGVGTPRSGFCPHQQNPQPTSIGR
jgi:hypothetical protein